jgi:pimeloyl-ACP methyl ester carboxylesterase
MLSAPVPPVRHLGVRANGLRFHVAEAGPEGGPLALLLHGFPEDWTGWRHQIGQLADVGLRVWAPDQRGYGLSDKPEGVAAYDLDRLAADAAGLIEAAGAERAVVVGHDWGAAVAWWLAATRPDVVERLAVLNVPHPATMRRFLRTHPTQMARSWYIGFFQIPGLPEATFPRFAERTLEASSAPGTFSESALAHYRAAWRRPGAATAMLNWYRAAARRLARAAPDLDAIAAPTLVLWGEDDVALDVRMAAASLEHCADARLVTFPGVSHWVQHEAAEAVTRHLLEHAGVAGGARRQRV